MPCSVVRPKSDRGLDVSTCTIHTIIQSYNHRDRGVPTRACSVEKRRSVRTVGTAWAVQYRFVCYGVASLP